MEDSKFNKIGALVLAVLFFGAGIFMSYRETIINLNEKTGVLYLMLGSFFSMMLLFQVKDAKFAFNGVLTAMIVSAISLVIYCFSIWGDDIEFVVGATGICILIYVFLFFKMKKKIVGLEFNQISIF